MDEVLHSHPVIRAVGALLDIDEARIAPTTPLVDLVTDSFVLVELAIELQEEFDVQLEAQDLQLVTTVQDLVDLIASRS